jgi:hypothetical protein
MCPACMTTMTTVAIAAVSATSAGGLLAIIATKFHVIKRALGRRGSG